MQAQRNANAAYDRSWARRCRIQVDVLDRSTRSFDLAIVVAGIVATLLLRARSLQTHYSCMATPAWPGPLCDCCCGLCRGSGTGPIFSHVNTPGRPMGLGWDGIGLELLDEPGYWEHCYWLLLSLVLSFALPQGFERLLPRARPRRPLPLLEGAKAANTADLRHVYQSCVL